MCCIFHVFESAGAQECCLPVSRTPLPVQKPGPRASRFLVGRRGKPRCGMWACPCRLCRAHLKVWCCLCSQPGHSAAPAGAAMHSAPVLPGGPHTPLTFRNRFFFLPTLATGNEEWTDFKGHDCTACLFQNISLSMQWNLNYSTILDSQPVSSRSPRSIQTG